MDTLKIELWEGKVEELAFKPISNIEQAIELIDYFEVQLKDKYTDDEYSRMVKAGNFCAKFLENKPDAEMFYQKFPAAIMASIMFLAGKNTVDKTEIVSQDYDNINIKTEIYGDNDEIIKTYHLVIERASPAIFFKQQIYDTIDRIKYQFTQCRLCCKDQDSKNAIEEIKNLYPMAALNITRKWGEANYIKFINEKKSIL